MKVIKKISAAHSKLCYSLVEETSDSGVSYGIKIESTLFGDAEEAFTGDISPDCSRVDRLMCLLADNAVLPSTLSEIVEEYLTAAYTIGHIQKPSKKIYQTL